MNLAYADVPYVAITERNSLPDGADHDDAQGLVGEGDGGGREGAKHVDDRHRCLPLGSHLEQTWWMVISILGSGSVA